MSLIRYNARIHFAENALADVLEPEMAALGCRRLFVVADDGPDRTCLIDRFIAALGSTISATFWQAPPGAPAEGTCDAAATIFRDFGADAIVGFGGRTAITLAKAIGLRASHPGPLRALAGQRGGSVRISPTIPPIIAVPTTPDACCEISPVAGIAGTDGAHIWIASFHLLPQIALCDPILTLDLPAGRMAGAAMDVLTHCIETFSASAYNPPADGIARDGLRRAITSIERAVSGDDLSARRELMAAALNGALACQKGLGAVHAMSHALGSLDNALDHGAVNAVLLPHVLAFNAPAIRDRLAEIRADFGLRRGVDLSLALAELRERIGLPSTLRALGLGSRVLERAAAAAPSDYSNRTNPRRADAGDYLAMLTAAW